MRPRALGQHPSAGCHPCPSSRVRSTSSQPNRRSFGASGVGTTSYTSIKLPNAPLSSQRFTRAFENSSASVSSNSCRRNHRTTMDHSAGRTGAPSNSRERTAPSLQETQTSAPAHRDNPAVPASPPSFRIRAHHRSPETLPTGIPPCCPSDRRPCRITASQTQTAATQVPAIFRRSDRHRGIQIIIQQSSRDPHAPALVVTFGCSEAILTSAAGSTISNHRRYPR